MEQVLHVPPLGRAAKLADILMVPLMYAAAGTVSETPQRTHRWNNRKLTPKEVSVLDAGRMAHYYGATREMNRGGWRFHLPIFGGWRDYVVLEPDEETEWHVGWIAPVEVIGVSRVRLSGPVRVLRGTDDVCFFGINAKDFRQIRIKKVGRGTIGQGGPYACLPLL